MKDFYFTVPMMYQKITNNKKRIRFKIVKIIIIFSASYFIYLRVTL